MTRPAESFTLGIAPADSAIEASATVTPLWFGFTMATAVLAVAALEARSHVARVEAGSASRRLLRIVLAASLLAGASTLFLVVEFVMRPEADDKLLLIALVALLVQLLICMAGVAVIDFWLGIFRPRRSRPWLVLAVAAYVLIAAALTFSFWLAGAFDELLGPETLQLLAIAAAAGVTWWSRLPESQVRVERHFE